MLLLRTYGIFWIVVVLSVFCVFQLSNILSFYFLINSCLCILNLCSFLCGLAFIFLDWSIIPVFSVYVWHFVQLLNSLIYLYMCFLISIFLLIHCFCYISSIWFAFVCSWFFPVYFVSCLSVPLLGIRFFDLLYFFKFICSLIKLGAVAFNCANLGFQLLNMNVNIYWCVFKCIHMLFMFFV